MSTNDRRPTSRQLGYLKALGERTGMTFTYPETAAQASSEIDRLSRAERSSRAERRADRDAVRAGLRAGPASTVRRDEIAGFGSTARWGGTIEEEPA